MLDFKGEFNAGHKEVLDSMLLVIPGVRAGKMFGYPGYYVNGKLFACVYREGISVKLPEPEREKLLADKDVGYFVPMANRPMKEWLLIKKADSEDYREYEDVFLAAVQYVASLPAKSRKLGKSARR